MQEIRWVQRFQNYQKAILNIEEIKQCIDENGLNKIYTMALIQAFEISFELAWKTVKDYLQFNGIKVDTPREVIKEAFANNILKNGQLWIEMMEARNKTSHTYKEEFANELANDILNTYIPQLEILSEFFEEKSNG